MEPKKNPNVDPRRNSFIYFSLGLMAMVVLSYMAIELKTYEKDFFSIGLYALFTCNNL